MSVLCSARGSKIVRSKAAPEGTRKALRGVRRARCAATEPALPARSAEGSLRRGLHAAVLAQMSARSSWSFDVAGDLELPLSSQRGVCGARRRARIGALCRRWRGRGAARVRLRCALPHTGVDFEQDCGKRLQKVVAPHVTKYSFGRRALAWPRVAWTARRKPARVEGGPLVCAVGTAVPDASRCCQ